MILGNETLRPTSGLNSPEWRWKRAVRCAMEVKRTVAFELDDSIESAYNYYRAMKTCVDDYDWDDLHLLYHDECLALSYWVDPIRMSASASVSLRPSLIEARRQAVLEAYLLAGLSHTEVAARLTMTTKAVELYEDWFYDFRRHLSNINWMTMYGTRGDVSGDNECSFESILRHCGWQHGVQVVDDLLRGTNYSEVTQKVLRNDIQNHLAKNSTISARHVYSQNTLFEATSRAYEINDRAKEVAINAGTDARSNEERVFIDQAEHEITSLDWCMVNVPDGVASTIPKVEKRLATVLGYDKDLSIKQASD